MAEKEEKIASPGETKDGENKDDGSIAPKSNNRGRALEYDANLVVMYKARI